MSEEKQISIILKLPTNKCIHNKRKSNCKECGGSNICIHNRQKSKCKDCGGSYICQHGRRKNECKDCKGASICEHNKQKYICKECGGKRICEHGKRKNICKECKGSSICLHNNIKSYCKECKGGSICEHNNVRSKCKECGGISICEHKKEKKGCIICNPSCACENCKSVFVDKRTKCYPLCKACFCNKYPDHKNSTLYKIKERYLRDELRVKFPNNNINMIFDKKVKDGCSSRKPDVLIDCLTHSIIIECDEEQHKNYKCEERRIHELYLDLGDIPLILIRFNPDGYINENNEKIEGCFKPLIKIEDIHKRKFYNINKKEWNKRIDILVNEIKKYLDFDNIKDTFLYREIRLFYDN